MTSAVTSLAPRMTKLSDEVRPKLRTQEAWKEIGQEANGLLETVDEMLFTDHSYERSEIDQVRGQLRDLKLAMMENLDDHHVLGPEDSYWTRSKQVELEPQAVEVAVEEMLPGVSYVLNHTSGLSSITDASVQSGSVASTRGHLSGHTSSYSSGVFYRVGSGRVSGAFSGETASSGHTDSLGLSFERTRGFLADLAAQRAEVTLSESYSFASRDIVGLVRRDSDSFKLSEEGTLARQVKGGKILTTLDRALDKQGFRNFVHGKAVEVRERATKGKTLANNWLAAAAGGALVLGGVLALGATGAITPGLGSTFFAFSGTVTAASGVVCGALSHCEASQTARLATTLETGVSQIDQALEGPSGVGRPL